MRGYSFVLAVGLSSVLSVMAARAEPVSVGQKAPDFKATTIAGKTLRLADTKGTEVTVIGFTCTTCPVARAYESRFVDFVSKFSKKGVKFIALDSNKTDNLTKMKKRAAQHDFNFPFAYDKGAVAADAYGAKVTPHLFVINRQGVVVYIGSFDNNMNAKKVTKHYVSDVVDALLAGKKPPVAKTRAFGCSIRR